VNRRGGPRERLAELLRHRVARRERSQLMRVPDEAPPYLLRPRDRRSAARRGPPGARRCPGTAPRHWRAEVHSPATGTARWIRSTRLRRRGRSRCTSRASRRPPPWSWTSWRTRGEIRRELIDRHALNEGGLPKDKSDW